MGSEMRVTITVAKVLAAFLSDPDADHYGLALMQVTGHPSGTLYPILARLERAGWVSASWEAIDPAVAGRPARRYYRLTNDGRVAAERELATLRRQMFQAPPPRPRMEPT